MAVAMVTPASVEDLIETVRSNASLMPRGGGTKPSLWEVNGPTTLINLCAFSGIVEYQPSEYTITVQSGTRLTEVIAALNKNGQYLPFDPPLASAGATLGGTVAAGLSGPGAYRFGPLKDFIIGVRFVDGLGNFVRGGGKVVKNAAGFDFPKLFNGSMGRLGILTEISFKVFPEPKAYVTLQTQFDSDEEALRIMPLLKGFDLEGVELNFDKTLFLRLGYQEPTMKSRKDSLEKLIGKTLDQTLDEEEPRTWQAINAFDWSIQDGYVVKIATHPGSALSLLQALDTKQWKTHVSNGGKTLYVSAPCSADIESLSTLLETHKLAGLQLRGPGPVSHNRLMGYFPALSFVQRVQSALDPNGVFQPFSNTSTALTQASCNML